MGWAGYAARIGEMRIAYRYFIRKPERKELLGRSKCGYENNTKTDDKEMWGGTGFDWPRRGFSGRFFEHGSELRFHKKRGIF
jgi:hypothetical protein